MYGFDVKPIKEHDTYLNYSEFMRVRNALNLISHKNSTCILRNKLYFSFISIGIKTPQIVAYSDKGVLFSVIERKNVKLSEFIDAYKDTYKTFL